MKIEIQNPGAGIQKPEWKPVAPAKSFEQLIVWQKAHQLVLMVYHLTGKFPHTEAYGLTSQFRWAAVSVPANIAEGFKKRGRPDKIRYLNIAQGSLEECRYYIILARDLRYAYSDEMRGQLEEVSKLLEAYSAKILGSGS